MTILDSAYKPPMRYLGGKTKVGDRIIRTFPRHHSYVEPFMGSAAVYLRKPLANVNYLIDRDHHIVNLFKVIREQPLEFVDAIKNTPYAHEEFDRCVTAFAEGRWDSDLEHARIAYTVLHQSLFGTLTPPSAKSGKSTWKMSYGKSEFPHQRHAVFEVMDHQYKMLTQKLRRAQIDCGDALELLPNFLEEPRNLVYCDPPYIKTTRSTKSDQYKHDMDDEFHVRLLEMLNDAKCAVAISGYRNPLYDELLKGWERLDMQVNHNVVHPTADRDIIDCLWTSYPIPAAAREQTGLFDLPLEAPEDHPAPEDI